MERMGTLNTLISSSPTFDPHFFKGLRVAITGHTGFKGAWLSLWLHRLGAKVYGFSLRPPSSPYLFDVLNLHQDVATTEGDLRNASAVQSFFSESKPDCVFHLGAQPLVRASYSNPLETYETNVLGTLHVLDALRNCPSVRACVVITTDKCYENKETERAYKESDSLGGFDPYSSSKACAEIVAASFRRSFFDQTLIATARAGNVLGGGDWGHDRLIPDLIGCWARKENALIRYPQAVRPWQHVLEPLSGYLTLAEKLACDKKFFAQAWNFGPPEESHATVATVTQKLSSAWGPAAEWSIDASAHPHEAGLLKLDGSHTHQHLRWQPRWNLDQALTATAAWYKNWYSKPLTIRAFTEEQLESYHG